MFHKPIKQVTKPDLEALVGNVRGSKTLDYKRTLPGRLGDSNREFLADVS